VPPLDHLIYFTPSPAGDSVHGPLFASDRTLTTGEGPFLALSSGQLPLGLAIATPYWVIARGAAATGGVRFQLATSEANARAGIPVDVTAPGSGLYRLHRVGATSH